MFQKLYIYAKVSWLQLQLNLLLSVYYLAGEEMGLGALLDGNFRRTRPWNMNCREPWQIKSRSLHSRSLHCRIRRRCKFCQLGLSFKFGPVIKTITDKIKTRMFFSLLKNMPVFYFYKTWFDFWMVTYRTLNWTQWSLWVPSNLRMFLPIYHHEAKFSTVSL